VAFAADVHEMVAERIVAGGLRPVLDVGSGRGRLREALPAGWPWIGVDSSPAQLGGDRTGAVVLGDAAHLPFPAGRFGAVAALYMLYHLDDPTVAIAEARRVLTPGGVFFACTRARISDPELTDGYPPTTFDAEEASALVGFVFGVDAVEVTSWDAPLAAPGPRCDPPLCTDPLPAGRPRRPGVRAVDRDKARLCRHGAQPVGRRPARWAIDSFSAPSA
jgi:SAM-dependent methyltransferase